mmetsp:Transcript_40297/g.93399  ORF Transcript_40297/g.93399 Transcript_40297/m.93399 type:complete len:106 (+) Transcript_40297:147-464(+)
MWLAKQTTRTIEASYVLVLLCFVGFMPFCFQVMPDDDVGPTLPETCVESGKNLLTTELTGARDCGLKMVQACVGKTDSVVSPLSMLIALIGGGVFSLEAFEAFPV